MNQCGKFVIGKSERVLGTVPMLRRGIDFLENAQVGASFLDLEGDIGEISQQPAEAVRESVDSQVSYGKRIVPTRVVLSG